MKEGDEKKIFAIIAVVIIVLAVFVVITYTQLSELNKENEEKKDLPLLVTISLDERIGTVPFEVKYTPLVLNAGGNIRYKWDFGDGETSDEINPIHTYTKDGIFVCNLTVADSNGKQKFDTIEIIAKRNEPPIATIKIDDANIMRDYIPLLPKIADPFSGRALYRLITYNIIPDSWLEKEGLVHCSAQVSDPEGDEIVSYAWVLTKPIIISASGSIQPKYNFEGPNVTFPLLYTFGDGQYDVQLTVTDSAGNNATVNIPFKIEKSSIETTMNYIIKMVIIDKFLNTIYAQYLPPEIQHLISDPLWNFIFGPLEEFSYDFLNKTIIPYLPEGLQTLVLRLYYMVFGMIEQKFPRPYETADLVFSDIKDYDLSASVELDGSVLLEANDSCSFTIMNNDSSNPAEEIYIMLEDPVTGDSGLSSELEKGAFEIIVSIGGETKKMFYEGKYRDCFITDKLATDDEFTIDITIILREAEAGTFTKGVYENNLYIYQKDAKHVDNVAFNVII